MPRSNPIDVQKVRLPDSERTQERIRAIVKQVTEAERARDDWGKAQRKYIRQRYGVRTKPKTTPWKGASNLNIPLIDKAIRRWKPGIVRLVLESTPVAHFQATEQGDIEQGRTAEQTYDWLFRTHMTTTDEVNYLADIIAMRGTGYVEVGWEYRTERRARVARRESVFPEGLPQLKDLMSGEPLLDARGQPQPDLAAIAQGVAAQYGLYPDRRDHMAAIERATNLFVAGEESIRIVYRDVVADRPRIVALDPLQVVLPPRETNVGSARYMAIRHLVSLNDLRCMARDDVLERAPVEEVVTKIEERARDATSSDIGDPTTTYGRVEGDIQREDRDTVDELVGIMQAHEEPETIEIWKIFCWLDADGDGIDERVILWWHPGTQTRLALMEYTLPFDRWPVVEFAFERTHSKRSLASRGIAQLLSPLQTEVNRLHNNRLDAQAIQLAPVLLVRQVGNTTRQLRMAPGTIFPVQNPEADVRPLVHDLRNLQEYLKEEQFVRLIAEEYVGIYDASLGNVSAPSNSRTATEVEAVQAQTSSIFSLDALLWQLGWGEVHRLIWTLWLELGPPEVTIRVAGEDGVQFIKVRRADVAKNFDIKPAGTPTNTNKALELARAREVMQILWNPFTFQTGAVQPLGLLNWYLGAHDPKRARQIVVQDEAAMSAQQLIMQAASKIAEQNQTGQFDAMFSGASQVPGQEAGANAR